MKKLLSCILVLSLMIGLIGSAAQAEQATPEPITFTALSTYESGPVWGEDPISQEITRRTGVSLDIVYNVSGNIDEMLGMLIASGDLPDLFLSMDNTHLSQLVAAEAVIDMAPYMETGGENIKAIMGDDYNSMRSETDGVLYGFNREYGRISTTPNYTFNVCYALLQEFGYPQINTVEELQDYVAQYLAKYPEYDGKANIGFLTMGSGWTFNIGFNNAALAAAGFKDNGNYYVNDDTLDVMIGIRTQQAKDYFKWLNGVTREGLFSLDSFTLDMTAFQTAAAQGNVLVCMNPAWVMSDVNTALREAGLEDRQFAPLPIYINEEAAASSQLNDTDNFGSWKSMISATCEDPQRAFDFFDTMWSEEMQVLCNWGIEGEDYAVDENGIRTMNQEVVDNYLNNANFIVQTGIGAYTYWSVGDLFEDSTGQYILPFSDKAAIHANYDETTKAVLAAYNPEAEIWNDLFPQAKISVYGLAWKLVLSDDSDGAVAETMVNDELRSKYVYRLVTARDDAEYEATWNEFVQACLNAGIESREAEIKNLLELRMKLWYGEN